MNHLKQDVSRIFSIAKRVPKFKFCPDETKARLDTPRCEPNKSQAEPDAIPIYMETRHFMLYEALRK